MREWLLRFEDGPMAGTTRVYDPERFGCPDEAPEMVLAWESMLFSWLPFPDTPDWREKIRWDEERAKPLDENTAPMLLYKRQAASQLSADVAAGHPNVARGAVYVLADDEHERWQAWQDSGLLGAKAPV